MIFRQNVSPRRAAEVLHRVFDRVPRGFAFRLWDGSELDPSWIAIRLLAALRLVAIAGAPLRARPTR